MSVSLRGAGAVTTTWYRRSSYVYNPWGRRSSTADLFTRNNLCFDRTQTCNNTSEREPRKHQDPVIPSSGQGRSGNSLHRGGHAGSVWGTEAVCELLRSDLTCLLEHPVQQLFLVWTSHTRELIAAGVRELNRVAPTWIIYCTYYRFRNPYIQLDQQKCPCTVFSANSSIALASVLALPSPYYRRLFRQQQKGRIRQ